MPHFKASGPLSIQGAPNARIHNDAAAAAEVLRLKVVSVHGQDARAGVGVVSSLGVPDSVARLLQPTGLLSLATGSDCVLTVRLDDSLPEACLALDDVQQHNLHLVAGERYNFRVFLPPTDEAFDLVDLDAEARLLPAVPGSAGGQPGDVQVEARQLTAAFAKQCFGHVLAVNEVVVVEVSGVPIVVRLTAVNTLTEEEREEAVGYHCFRGRLTADPAVFITSADACPTSLPATPSSAGPTPQQPGPHPTTHLHRQLSEPAPRPTRPTLPPPSSSSAPESGQGGLAHSTAILTRSRSSGSAARQASLDDLLAHEAASTSISRSNPTPGSQPLPMDAFSFQVHGANLFPMALEVLSESGSLDLAGTSGGSAASEGAEPADTAPVAAEGGPAAAAESASDRTPWQDQTAAASAGGLGEGGEGAKAAVGKANALVASCGSGAPSPFAAAAADADADAEAPAAQASSRSTDPTTSSSSHCGTGSSNGSAGSGDASRVAAPLTSTSEAGPCLVLRAPRTRAARPAPTNVCHVTTRDGEWFPVKKAVLRPCIALTQHVRSGEAVAPAFSVDVDTLTFDRVLIFLEALATGAPTPAFGIHLLDALLQAAKTLGLRALQDHCEQRLGAAAAQLRIWRFHEVASRNREGGCWLILDGMVLDVTRWLPEHPGGSAIIPEQALDMDCARFFEIYHASRESFVYLKEFYMGEVDPQDRPLIPAGTEPPSADFLAQLREYTTFRMATEEAPKAFKSF